MSLLTIRLANKKDSRTYFHWANDPLVRELSYDSEVIPLSDHTAWFEKKLQEPDCHLYIFHNEQKILVGQVRIEIEHNHEAVIGISIDIQLRGNGHGIQMLELAVVTFRKEHPKTRINAYIKIENKSSQVIFEKAHFNLEAEILYKNVKSYHYVRNEDC
mgnify:FL=1|jgi:RimJ/RimL family protein N-acetyltransferase